MSDGLIEEESQYLSDDPESKVLDNTVLQGPIRRLEPREPLCVDEGTTAGEAIRLMQEHRIGCVLVTRGGHLAGIFTERDVLRRVVGAETDATRLRVADLMTPDPEVLTPEDPMTFALNKMSLGGFRHVPLVDGDGRPVGIISVKDIVDYIVEFFPNDVLNVPPGPGRDIPRSREGA